MAGIAGSPGICGSDVGNDKGSGVGTGNQGSWKGVLAGTLAGMVVLAGCAGPGPGAAPRGPSGGAGVASFARGLARPGVKAWGWTDGGPQFGRPLAQGD